MKSRSKAPWIVLLIVSLLIFFLCVGVVVWYFAVNRTPSPVFPAVTPTTSAAETTVPTTPTTAVPLVDNPIDFASLQALNSDAYAWLHVPGTAINEAVLCASDQSDEFYLYYDINKVYTFSGSIYSEKQNGREMASRHTVMYGHNMLDGSKFASLHDFRDETFFQEHDKMYVYMPGKILTYTIFAAYDFDDRHLLNCFDLSDDAVWAQYVGIVNDPTQWSGFKRDGITVTTADKILTLSTCHAWNSSVRYLVQGVLTDVQLTK